MQDTAFGRFADSLDYPLYVVTTATADERSGCLVGFATLCSIDPPRFLACVSRKNHTFRVVQQATLLAVHRLEEDQKHLAGLFGGETGDEVDKFARVRWHGVRGVPVLDECPHWFIGSILARIDLGDHMGLLLQPLDVRSGEEAGQLMVHQARDIDAGHEA